MGRRLENALAVLNGLVGDHLARTGNGLGTPMELIHDGEPLGLDAASILRAHPHPTPRVVVLVHGLMNTEAIWELVPPATGGGQTTGDYGRLLERDAGFTPFYLRYNSGLPITDNGAALARLLDELVVQYRLATASQGPLVELLLVGYSMGGLVVRSALHAARPDSPFLSLVRRVVYVGTPHLGAPYERLGRVVSSVLRAVPDPYTRLISDVANLRSAGLQDLGDADLRHEDRTRRTVLRPAGWEHPLPLPAGVKHYLIAGSLASAAWLQGLFGDAMVPVPSALAGGSAGAPRPTTTVQVMPGLSHVALAHDLQVYAQILAWVRALPDEGAA